MNEPQRDPAAVRRVHAAYLGYQPYRMKPVHFATGFLLALTGRHFDLEWLNKASVPKAAPKDKRNALDEYPSDRLYQRLIELGRLSYNISLDDFRVLRAHLNAAYNNDGAALNAAFPPYDSFGSDYSAPSLKYISDRSKNHGYSGSFIVRIFQSTETGREILLGCRKLLDGPHPPLAELGAPLLDNEDCEWIDRYDEMFGNLADTRVREVNKEMEGCTAALACLVSNLLENQTAYALRYLIIGLCSWLFVYLMRRNNSHPLLLIDAMQGSNFRIRTQSCASYARQLDLFSVSYEDRWEKGFNEITKDDWSSFLSSVEARQSLDDHFRDLGVRIGFVQPRSPIAKKKHIEVQADTLKVLAMSLLRPGQIVTLSDFAKSLRETWCLIVGADADDTQILRTNRFTPLDADEDLQPNAASFRALLVRLGIAVEPSDGLTLCAINAEDLI